MIRIGTRVETRFGQGVVVGNEEHYGEKFPIVQLDDPGRWACWDGVHHPVFRNKGDLSEVAGDHFRDATEMGLPAQETLF